MATPAANTGKLLVPDELADSPDQRIDRHWQQGHDEGDQRSELVFVIEPGEKVLHFLDHLFLDQAFDRLQKLH